MARLKQKGGGNLAAGVAAALSGFEESPPGASTLAATMSTTQPLARIAAGSGVPDSRQVGVESHHTGVRSTTQAAPAEQSNMHAPLQPVVDESDAGTHTDASLQALETPASPGGDPGAAHVILQPVLDAEALSSKHAHSIPTPSAHAVVDSSTTNDGVHTQPTLLLPNAAGHPSAYGAQHGTTPQGVDRTLRMYTCFTCITPSRI